jgi:hypothetical protein
MNIIKHARNNNNVILLIDYIDLEILVENTIVVQSVSKISYVRRNCGILTVFWPLFSDICQVST